MFNPPYAMLVGLAVAIALFFPVTKHLKDRRQRLQYYVLQSVTLIGAVIGAKLAVLVGDFHWPWTPMEDWHILLTSGRSITGALILGFIAAEITKPLIGYKLPPNDKFATVLPFTVGMGRVGCFFAGCCRGIPHEGFCTVTYDDGISRYPTQLFEVAFQLAVGVTFLVLLRKGLLKGRLFNVYLIAYGLFRFVTEFIRETPKQHGPFSTYQVLSLVMVVIGAAFLAVRSRRVPDGEAGPAAPAA